MTCMEDRDVLLIQQYIDENRVAIADERDSYANWADEEIATRTMMEVMRYYDQDQFIFGTMVEWVIVEFIEDMEEAWDKAKGERSRRAFSTAIEEAENMLKYICDRKALNYENTRYCPPW